MVRNDLLRRLTSLSFIFCLLASPLATSETELSDDIQSLKESVLELNRDLLILEEELLFPANTQIAVYLSVDVGEFFKLDSVTLKIDGDEVTHYLYTDRQVSALQRGGVQRLYLGNLKTGEHEITAVYTGWGPHNRAYKRGVSTKIVKELDPAWIELQIKDSPGKQQPEFFVSRWDS
ncbi:MAG: AraC family transcriptional regulator [Cellvibrionaceae bacterium]